MSLNIDPNAFGDFHVHSSYSDGKFSPNELIFTTRNTKLKTLCITDHFITRGYDKGRTAADWLGVDLIPGTEISAKDYKSFHFVGLGMNNRNKIDEVLSDLSTNNEMKLVKLICSLENQGVLLENGTVERLLEQGICRKAIAKEITRQGFAKTRDEAYKKYVAQSVTDFQTHKLNAKEAIELITKCGGVPVLSHPQSVRCRETGCRIDDRAWEPLLSELKQYGLQGIESIAVPDSPNQRHMFKYFAKNLGLIESGGSDFHGERYDGTEKLGNSNLTQDHIDIIKDAIKTANDLHADTVNDMTI